MNGQLKTVIANIKYAIRSNETVSIGGGLFSPNELQLIVDLYNVMMKQCDMGEICLGCTLIVCPDTIQTIKE